MGFSWQEYWRGLSFPSPGDLPSPGMEPRSPALQANSLRFESPLGVNSRYQVKSEEHWAWSLMVSSALPLPPWLFDCRHTPFPVRASASSPVKQDYDAYVS